jgi:hypothetical protein
MLTRVVERIAEPRIVAAPLEVPELVNASSELRRWARLFETHDLEVVDPSEAELRAPGLFPKFADLIGAPRPSLVADVVAAFTGSSVVVQQSDMSFLASWVGAKDGASRVYYFHPSDWGVWPTDASLSARLFRILQEEDRPEHADRRFEGHEEARYVSALKLYEATVSSDRLPELADPGRLFARSEWLVRALVGAGRPLESALPRAAPLRDFSAESRVLLRHSHLALYWLWAQFFLGNETELSTTIALTAESTHPWVHQVRSWMSAWLEGDRRRLGVRTVSEIAETIDELADVAPPELFGSTRRRAVRRRRDAASAFDVREAEARDALEARAETDLRIREALDLLDHLRSPGALPPPETPAGLGVASAVDRLCELLDADFVPLLDLRLERAARVPDSHVDAGWGLLEAAAVLSPDLASFEAKLARVGTSNLGPRRMAELYRAIGRFPDEAATERLLQAAYAWLAEVDDWIRSVPAEPVLEILRRDVLPTHELIAKLLERATFTAANVDVCVEAARAAGRLRSQRAIPGLRRAVSRGLGRISDGGRADVARALYEIEKKDALPIFRARLDALVERWESAEDDDEVWTLQKDLAALMPGALPAVGEDVRVQEVVRSLVGAVSPRLRSARPVAAETLESARALAEGVRRAEQPGLAFRLREWRKLDLVRAPSNRRALERLQVELRSLEEELL